MEIRHVSRKRYVHTIFWALLLSLLLVAIIATLGRAEYNFTAALTEKPDIAIYLLLPDEEIGKTKVLREVSAIERHYYAETKDGPKLVILKKGEEEWYVSEVEPLRE